VVVLLFGVLLLAVAVKQWQGRPRPGETPEMPKWMAADGFPAAVGGVPSAVPAARFPATKFRSPPAGDNSTAAHREAESRLMSSPTLMSTDTRVPFGHIDSAPRPVAVAAA
jgi:hypothetical protein